MKKPAVITNRLTIGYMTFHFEDLDESGSVHYVSRNQKYALTILSSDELKFLLHVKNSHGNHEWTQMTHFSLFSVEKEWMELESMCVKTD